MKEGVKGGAPPHPSQICHSLLLLCLRFTSWAGPGYPPAAGGGAAPLARPGTQPPPGLRRTALSWICYHQKGFPGKNVGTSCVLSCLLVGQTIKPAGQLIVWERIRA